MKKSLSIFVLLQIAVVSFPQKNTLDFFITQALTNSPLLKDYQGQILSFSIDSQILRAMWRPQVNGVSNNSYFPVINGWGYDNAITNGAQIFNVVAVSKTLPSNKSIATLLSNLQLQSLALSNSIKISEQDLKKVITDQYITVYGGQLQLEFNGTINKLLSREDSMLKKLTQNNVYKQSDYLAFVVTRQQQLLNSSQLEIQYTLDYTTLNFLAGIVDTAINRLQDPRLSQGGQVELSNSVFYRQFILDSLKLVNDKALIDVNYRPKINAYADAGYNSSLATMPYKNFGVSVGLNLSIPLYDGRQRKMQYAKIDIQEKTRIGKRDFFVQQRQQQLLQLLQQLHSTDRLAAQLDQQIRYTETLITVNEKLLATGDVRLVDFILALSNYYNARNLLTQNYISRLKIINQLNYWVR